jgi:hypothetical protein
MAIRISNEHVVLQPETTLAKVTVSESPLQYPKWFGGSASCMAAVCSHPLDLGTCINSDGMNTGPS